MKTITFTSKSEKKLNQLVEVAGEMGIKEEHKHELSDEAKSCNQTERNKI
jgi:hypothetical protein